MKANASENEKWRLSDEEMYAEMRYAPFSAPAQDLSEAVNQDHPFRRS